MIAENTLVIRPRSGQTVPLSSYIRLLWGVQLPVISDRFSVEFCLSWPNWSWHCQICCSVWWWRDTRSAASCGRKLVTWKDRKIDSVGDRTTRASLNQIAFNDSWLMTWSTIEQQRVPTWSRMTSSDQTGRRKERGACQLASTHRGQVRNWSWTTRPGTNRLIMDHASN